MLQRRADSDAAIARPGLLHACRADQAVQNSSAKRDPPARSSGPRSDLRGASELQWCRADRPSGHLAHAFRLQWLRQGGLAPAQAPRLARAPTVRRGQ